MAKDNLDRRWLYAIYIALFVTAAYGVAIFITYCLICQPLDAYWLSYDFSYKKSFTCISGNALTLTSGVLSVLSDCYAVVLPCLMLRHYDLDVPKRQKIALNVIFALGFLYVQCFYSPTPAKLTHHSVTGAGIARTYYLWRINHTFDTSWTGFTLYVWSIVELHLAIICACAPSLRAFFRHYLRDTLKRTFDTFGSASYYGGSRKDAERRTADDEREADGVEKGRDVHASERSESTQGLAADEERRIRTPEEYEEYVLEPLSRHTSIRGSRVLDLAAGTAVFPAFEATQFDRSRDTKKLNHDDNVV